MTRVREPSDSTAKPDVTNTPEPIMPVMTKAVNVVRPKPSDDTL